MKLLWAGIVLLAINAPAKAQVLKIAVDDAIQPITEQYVVRGLAQAERDRDKAVLITINTPGGLVDSTRKIIGKILASPVPVIVYVAPGGSRAASAGFYILESADVAAMAPGTNTGAAHPVSLFGDEGKGVMKDKIENDMAAWIRSLVAKRGRNVNLAESAVRESKSFTDQEALSQKLIDYVAPNEEDLFRQLQGKTVQRFDGKTATLSLVGEPVSLVEMTFKERVLAYVMNPNITFLLLIVGAFALYAEFNHPGAVVPGTVGVICILLAIAALNLLPLRFVAIVLILVSFVLFVLEAKFATHGALGAAGVAMLTFGGLLLVDSPFPEMRVQLWTALAVSVPFGIITVFLTNIALRARANKITTGEQGLVGEFGVAQTSLSPRGKVFVHGELWDATSSSQVSAGQRVVVKSLDGLQLRVEPVPTAQQSAIVR
jgi:membrane-bound serine protease (ClpP class)